MFQKHEVHHNSGPQVGEYLQKALEAVEQLDPPKDLRALVFSHAVQLFSAKTVTLEQISAGVLTPSNARH